MLRGQSRSYRLHRLMTDMFPFDSALILDDMLYDWLDVEEIKLWSTLLLFDSTSKLDQLEKRQSRWTCAGLSIRTASESHSNSPHLPECAVHRLTSWLTFSDSCEHPIYQNLQIAASESRSVLMNLWTMRSIKPSSLITLTVHGVCQTSLTTYIHWVVWIEGHRSKYDILYNTLKQNYQVHKIVPCRSCLEHLQQEFPLYHH